MRNPSHFWFSHLYTPYFQTNSDALSPSYIELAELVIKCRGIKISELLGLGILSKISDCLIWAFNTDTSQCLIPTLSIICDILCTGDECLMDYSRDFMDIAYVPLILMSSSDVAVGDMASSCLQLLSQIYRRRLVEILLVRTTRSDQERHVKALSLAIQHGDAAVTRRTIRFLRSVKQDF